MTTPDRNKPRRKKRGVTPERRARLNALRRDTNLILDRILDRNPKLEDRNDALALFVGQMLRVASFNGLRMWKVTEEGKRTREQGAMESMRRFLGGASAHAWIENLIRLTVEDYESMPYRADYQPLEPNVVLHTTAVEPENPEAWTEVERENIMASVIGGRMVVHPEIDTASGITLGDQIVLAHFKNDSEALLQLARLVDARHEGR